MQSPSITDWDSAFQYHSDDLFDENLFVELSASTDIAINTQIPTPPSSTQSSPSQNASDTVVSISSAFHPGALHSDLSPDLILLSCDSVFFFVHSQRLLEDSHNRFDFHLPVSYSPQIGYDSNVAHPIIALPESAEVLNIVLHTFYSISCNSFSPSVDCIIQAVISLRTYGAPIQTLVTPNMPLYKLILSKSPLYPIELYAVAAENDLPDLAVAISPHLLAYKLPNLTDELACKIGPIYLKRLFFLHLGRNDALKRLLLSPPALHGPTKDCDFPQQKKLTRAWAFATAYLAWDARPDLSTSSIESALGSLQDHLTCSLCQQTLKRRVRELVIEWSNVKRTV